MSFIWPVDYNIVLRDRLLLMRLLENDPERQRKYMNYYRTRPVEWITQWCYTFDPRVAPPAPRLMPFVLFPRQEDLVQFLWECLRDKAHGLIEKSRDMGASWIAVAFSAWLFIFHPGSTIGWGSRKEEYVDKKDDPKAIFPKIRQILENLPGWMLPPGFDLGAHATYMKIVNHFNGATITGEAGDNIGRGGRTTIYLKDESAHYERPESIEAALGDNTDVQIDISSVNGSANVFYRRRMAGEIWERGKVMTPGKVRVFVMDWRDHPGKTDEWYHMRRKRAEEEGLLHLFAQEVDRDYTGSVDGVIIPADWVRAAIDAHVRLYIDATGERVAGQDVADEGGDKNALAARWGVILKHVSHWGGEAGDAPRIALPICAELGVNEIFYDSIGVGAGFKAGANSIIRAGGIGSRIHIQPWSAADSVQDPQDHIVFDDPDTPLNENFFGNLKAQSWWRLRTRFYKTFKAITQGEKYPHDELISLPSDLPNLHQLTLELSQAVRTYNSKGKVIVDKTPEGSRSPNLADAVVMCFNPIRGPLGIMDVLGR